MQFFRLLHRQTKSEGDVSTLLSQPGLAGVTAPVFVPLQVSLPSFDPTREPYAPPIDALQSPMNPNPTEKLSARVMQMESLLADLQDERSTFEQDLVDYRTDLLNTRTELYSEMLCSARHQQWAMDNFRTIQRLEARHQRFCAMLVDIGIPRSTVDGICQVIQSGNGSPDDILVDAIKDALNDSNAPLSRLKPIVTNERTPEHYQSALNLALNIRKELKSQKKRSKFWKKLAQEDNRHANAVTPSPSDISSIRQDLSPERQNALDALVARRRADRYSENTDSDVFGGQRRESMLDSLASSLASRPRHSIQDNLRLSSSFSSASAASTTYISYLSGLSRISRDHTTETPIIPSRLPSPLSTSLRRSSRSSSQSIVLGSINMNVSRSSSIEPILPEETEQHTNPETGPVATVTLSQDLPQNVRRASQGQVHRRMPSTASRRSAPTRSARSSFRLSAFSPVRACRPAGPQTAPTGNATADAPSFHTPDIMMRLSDLVASTNFSSGTPASSEVTRSEESEDSLFTTTSASSLSANDTPAPTTPPTPSPSPAPNVDASSPTSSVGSGKASIGRSMLPVLAKHLRRLSLSKTSPDRERLVDKLRGLRSLSRSRSSSGSSGSPPIKVWRGSPARSESSNRSENLTPSPSPVKGSGIPVLQRRMTIRARRASVRKI